MTAEPLTLVIDQGTHSTRALAFDTMGVVQAIKSCKVTLRGHGTAFVEQDPLDILASVQQVIAEILAEPAVSEQEIAQVGLATQRSSVVAWDLRDGRPLAPMLSWQDRRAAKWIATFAPHAEMIKEQSGLPLSPHYGVGKLRWFLDNVPAVQAVHQAGYLAYGPLASFLIYHLVVTRPFVVDQVNASRTQLWNLDTRHWDIRLLQLFDIPFVPLPACQPTCMPYGVVQGLDAPLTAVNGDQNAAIYGLGDPGRETAIVNIGSGAFILCLTGKKIVRHSQLLIGLASSNFRQVEYLLEGTVNGAGNALTWLAEQHHTPSLSLQLAPWLDEISSPPIFINTIGGLGSPWWKAGPEPTFSEPTASLGEKAVAVIESILFMLQRNLELQQSLGLPIKKLRVSGGLANLDGLCRRLADLSQLPVYRPEQIEATARGIGWLAAGRPFSWKEVVPQAGFYPQPDPALKARYQQFCEAID